MMIASSSTAYASVNGNISAPGSTGANVSGANVTILASANGTGFDPISGLNLLTMVGQVFNNGTEPSENANVTTNLYDMNGTLIGFNTAPTVPATIEPNQSANFQTQFNDLGVIGGTANALFYEHDTGTPAGGNTPNTFLGFIPPPFLPFGAGAALAGSGVPLGPGGGIGGGGGFIGGGSGGGGSGGGSFTVKQITNQFIDCLINQNNAANNISDSDVDQKNIAVCKGNLIQIQQPAQPIPAVENKTQPEPENQSIAAFTGDTPQQAADNAVGVPPPIENSTRPTPNPPQQAADTAVGGLSLVPEPTIGNGEPGNPPNADGECNDGQEPANNICPEPLAAEPDCGNDGELVDGECVPLGCTSDNPPSSCPDTTAQLSAQQPNVDEPTTDEEENQQQVVESNDDGDSNDNNEDTG